MLKESANKKSRDSNFELLRIISMVMIVTLHYLGKGNLLSSNEGSITYYVSWALESLCYVAVNIYVLISGYYAKSKTFKLNKLLDLWIQTVFISASTCSIAIRLGIVKQLSMPDDLVSIMPITRNAYWFITTYFVFLAVVPFFVFITEKINRRQHKILCMTLITVTSVIPTVFFEVDWLRINKGYDIIWFVTLFFVASYIRKYDVFDKNPLVYLAGYVAFSAVGFASKLLVKKVFFNLYGEDISKTFYGRYNMFFVFAASVMLFLAFKNIHINGKTVGKIIMFFSSATVYVYLIHEAPCIKAYLWKKIVNPMGHLGFPDLVINFILGVGGVYIACSIIGKIIAEGYKLLRINKLTMIISDKVTRLAKKIIGTEKEINEAAE